MKKISLLFIVCLSFVLHSCVDMDDCTVDTDIDTQVLIVKSGFQGISAGDLSNGAYQVFLYKAGYNDETVTIRLTEDPTILDDYNTKYGTSYVALPSTYYTIGKAVSLDTKHYTDSISVTFNTAALENNSSETEYVLPLVISGIPAEKISQNNYILINYNNE